VLAPSEPQSMQIIDSMFKDLAQLYPGPFLHVGADETFELGTGKTRADVDARGLAPVYLDYMDRIVTDLQPLHRKILFWGDIAQSAPDKLKAMPQSFKDQAIVVQWGYSPQPKNFDKFLSPYANAGFQMWVAPAINNYRQVFPNQREALLDIQQFTRDGQKFGAQGQLNTLWNDDGESLANMNWYGILFGAAAAWQLRRCLPGLLRPAVPRRQLRPRQSG
jgi:hexosaminidase